MARTAEENFARLFNKVTIALWSCDQALCIKTNPGDLERAFTSGERDRMNPHERYFASPGRSIDQFLDFAEKHIMTVHAHPLVWGSEEWMTPFWLYEDFCPPEEKEFLALPRKNPSDETRHFAEFAWLNPYRKRLGKLFAKYDERELAAHCPRYLANLQRLYNQRIEEIMAYCGERVHSWDVVNESSRDWFYRCGTNSENNLPLTKSVYGIMPPNYVLEAFRLAAKQAPMSAKLAINDWNLKGHIYRDQIADLLAHGARIDMLGIQFHIFFDKDFSAIVNGEPRAWGPSNPDGIRRIFTELGKFGRPIHLSEITIPSPGGSPEAMQQQAIVAVNLYRAWFAQPACSAITWWHTLDGANATGGIENGWGGIMDAEGRPKPVYNALYDLIHRQWKTTGDFISFRRDDGRIAVRWRGFKGKYRVRFTGSDGVEHIKYVELGDQPTK
ncbi:MAG: endo-1,4-beta-xylanase [Kiritimatiellia bacterium]